MCDQNANAARDTGPCAIRRCRAPHWLLLPSLLALITLSFTSRAEAADDFDSTVAPLLARRCLNCHNSSEKKGGLDLSSNKGLETGGDSGPVLVAGKLDDSALWERVSQNEMPPKKPLPDDEKAILRDWIASGARWGTDPIDVFKYSNEARAGYDWWSLKPVQRPPAPALNDAAWPVNDVDHYVLASLEKHQLTPSAAADRRTLIRRVSFDLLGLPPEASDVQRFVVDDSEGAYARLVDRYLDSPQYGERWGRHWLDIVRFGESQGFERDKLRTTSWAYRDWIIAAFNNDLPYDEFIRLQLAGDVLKPDDPRAVIATGFLVAGPWDEVGQSQQSAAMRAVVRQDELEDLIGVTCQTFLGLTANCARCHDHKFDPISQKEYYRLAAALAGVKHGERERLNAAAQVAHADRQGELRAAIAELKQRQDAIDGPARRQLVAMRHVNPPPATSKPQPISRWEFNTDLRDDVGSLHGTAHGQARVIDGRLVLDGDGSYVVTEPLSKSLGERTIEVSLTLSRLDQQGGGALSVESTSGVIFDAIVYGERDAGQWMAGSNGFSRWQSFQAPLETEALTTPVQITLVYGADLSITAYRNGRLYGRAYSAPNLTVFEAGKSHVLFGLRHSPPGGNRFLTGAIDRAALYDRALSADEVASLAGIVSEHVTEDQLVAALTPDKRAERQGIAFELSRLETELRLLSPGKTYAVVPAAPEPTFELDRGNPAQKLAEVTPGGIRSLSLASSEFGLETKATDSERRAKLAEWITDARNPLTARVLVNRLWHYHMGTGIVDTPNDFGFNGSRPSHPELLDYLAAEFVEHGWSIKHMHRLILMSATYRQSSHASPVAMKVDAGNRLLWRRSPQRLEAEAVRDSILKVSGELNPVMGGPGFQDFRTFVFNSQFYEMLDPVGREFQRRTVYRTWVRSGRSEFLDVFDCPDPSTTSPRRAVTTTPLQALALLNNSFTLRMSDRFAERARAEAGPEIAGQVARVYELAYSRAPTGNELVSAVDFASKHGLPALCRVVFNSNEFLYVD